MPLTLDTSTALVIVRIPTIAPPFSHNNNNNDNSAAPSHHHNLNSASDTSAEQIDRNSDRYAATYMLFDPTDIQSGVSDFSWSRLATASKPAVLLGALLAAVSAFVTLVVAFIVSRRKSRQAAALMDKTPLVDDEVSVNVDADRLTIHV